MPNAGLKVQIETRQGTCFLSAHQQLALANPTNVGTLLIANHYPEKDVATVLDAARLLLTEGLRFRLDLIGDFLRVSDREEVARTIARLALQSSTAGTVYDVYADFGQGTWSYNLATGQYSKLQPVHFGYTGLVPAARKSPGFAGDGTKAFLFGGLDFDNATYELDFTTRSCSIVTPQGATTSPSARGEIQNQFVYDSTDNLYILFGGRCYDPSRCTYNSMLGDT